MISDKKCLLNLGAKKNLFGGHPLGQIVGLSAHYDPLPGIAAYIREI